MSDTERRLAAVLAEHAWLSSDEQKIGDEWTWGFHCDCGGFVPDAETNAHLAAALLPVVAEIEAEARVGERERVAAAIEAEAEHFRAITGAPEGAYACRVYTDAARIARTAEGAE